jgi:hypothetical protein
MEHIAAFILAVTCSGDLKDCRELPAPLPVYETIEDCSASLPAVRKQYGTEANLFVSCFEVDPELAEIDAEIVWDVTAAEGLTATVEPIASEEVLVAANQSRDANKAVVHP